jgi:rubrerythrin
MAECIEREAVFSAICKTSAEHDVFFPAIILDAIKSIPAADVRPVLRGKWRQYSPLTDTYECDKCGYQVIDESFRTNFCPNCGADMREPPKEDAI